MLTFSWWLGYMKGLTRVQVKNSDVRVFSYQQYNIQCWMINEASWCFIGWERPHQGKFWSTIACHLNRFLGVSIDAMSVQLHSPEPSSAIIVMRRLEVMKNVDGRGLHTSSARRLQSWSAPQQAAVVTRRRQDEKKLLRLFHRNWPTTRKPRPKWLQLWPNPQPERRLISRRGGTDKPRQ